MSDDEGSVFMAGFFICFLLSLLVFLGYIFAKDGWSKDEAVKHKAAEYYLDTNNVRQFRWLDEKEGE